MDYPIKKPHTEVSGISAVKDNNEIVYYPIWAKHAERDSLNRPFTSTYLTNVDFTSAIYNINQKIENFSATVTDTITSFSSEYIDTVNVINDRLNYISSYCTSSIYNLNNKIYNFSAEVNDTITSFSSDYIDTVNLLNERIYNFSAEVNSSINDMNANIVIEGAANGKIISKIVQEKGKIVSISSVGLNTIDNDDIIGIFK